eukprot:COSAG05_NODE_30584_length_102_cov_125.666667_1_plen_34_part_11
MAMDFLEQFYKIDKNKIPASANYKPLGALIDLYF